MVEEVEGGLGEEDEGGGLGEEAGGLERYPPPRRLWGGGPPGPPPGPLSARSRSRLISRCRWGNGMYFPSLRDRQTGQVSQVSRGEQDMSG